MTFTPNAPTARSSLKRRQSRGRDSTPAAPESQIYEKSRCPDRTKMQTQCEKWASGISSKVLFISVAVLLCGVGITLTNDTFHLLNYGDTSEWAREQNDPFLEDHISCHNGTQLELGHQISLTCINTIFMSHTPFRHFVHIQDKITTAQRTILFIHELMQSELAQNVYSTLADLEESVEAGLGPYAPNRQIYSLAKQAMKLMDATAATTKKLVSSWANELRQDDKQGSCDGQDSTSDSVKATYRLATIASREIALRLHGQGSPYIHGGGEQAVKSFFSEQLQYVFACILWPFSPSRPQNTMPHYQRQLREVHRQLQLEARGFPYSEIQTVQRQYQLAVEEVSVFWNTEGRNDETGRPDENQIVLLRFQMVSEELLHLLSSYAFLTKRLARSIAQLRHRTQSELIPPISKAQLFKIIHLWDWQPSAEEHAKVLPLIEKFEEVCHRKIKLMLTPVEELGGWLQQETGSFIDGPFKTQHDGAPRTYGRWQNPQVFPEWKPI